LKRELVLLPGDQVTEDYHRQVLELEADRRIVVGVDPYQAFSLFLDPRRRYSGLWDEVGSSHLGQRLLVRLLLVFAVLFALLAVFSSTSMGVWALIGLPATLLGLFYNHRQAGSGGGLTSSSLFFVVALTLYIFPVWSDSIAAWLLCLSAALLLSCLVYSSSAHFLKRLVRRNWKVLACLIDSGGVFLRIDPYKELYYGHPTRFVGPNPHPEDGGG
jgi:hypothetical protein